MDSFLLFVCLSLSVLSPSYASRETSETSSVQLVLRPKHVNTEDYYCSSTALPRGQNYIIGFEPAMTEGIAHHMLLFGCASVGEGRSWNCKDSGSVCSNGDGRILYAWAKEAPGLKFPKGVGIKVGSRANINTVIMQVHFHSAPHSEADYPRLKLTLTSKHQPKVAGIYLLGGMSPGLAPRLEDTTVEVACKFSGPNVIHPLGFRTHAHSLSPLIAGFVKSHSTKKWSLIGQHSPQEPQAFYPSHGHISIHTGDILAARCHYNTSGKSSLTLFGPDSENEMCNFYLMFYMKNNGKPLISNECWNQPPTNFKFPDYTQITKSLNVKDDNNSTIHHTTTTNSKPLSTIKLDEDWSMNSLSSSKSINRLLGVDLGQVAGVSVDDNDLVYMFHRGNHRWDSDSFSMSNRYLQRKQGPILTSPLLITDPSGKVTSKWGKGVFYLPHGLTVDSKGMIWFTDVARQQIFKLTSINRSTPLALGETFEPGRDNKHFCKPAAIIVDYIRDRFYVADGYCNHRIMVFTSKGSYITQYSAPIDGVSLQVPHSLALSSNGTKLYVADRENYRIVEYDTLTGNGKTFMPINKLGGAIYAITFSDRSGHWPMYAVNGSMDAQKKAVGFTIDERGEVIDTWSPHDRGFRQPHDIAVNNDGTALYVAEIGPNKVWKFSVNISSSSSQQLIPVISSSPTQSLTATPILQINNTTSCQPTPSPSNEDDVQYLCPRPPPPPMNCCPETSSITSSCSHCPLASQIMDSVVESDDTFPVLATVTVLVIMFTIIFLLLALVLFVRYRKRSNGHHQTTFKVQRHYSRNPKKKLDVLLHSDKKNGFSRVRTFDSESDEEFTVFQKT